MNRRQRKQPCVYCGAPNAGTRDHIPPEAFFPRPRPSNLLTVPCCEDCRREYQPIDDYVILVFGMDEAVSEHAMGARFQEARLRDLQRLRRGKVVTKLAKKMVPAELKLRLGVSLRRGRTD